MTPTTNMLYSCHQCGLRRIEVAVPGRTEENVTTWLQATASLLGADHNQRSPHCHIDSLDEVMIPMTGTDRVGGAPVQYPTHTPTTF